MLYEVHCSFLSFYGYFCSSHRTKNLRPRIEVPKEKRESESRPEPLSKFHKSYQESRTKLESGPRKQGRPCGSSRHRAVYCSTGVLNPSSIKLFTTFFPEKTKDKFGTLMNCRLHNQNKTFLIHGFSLKQSDIFKIHIVIRP